MSDSNLVVEIVQGDVLTFAADVLALKYAQSYYGSDAAVRALFLGRHLASEKSLQPKPGSYAWVSTEGCIPARRVLFLGVPPLLDFGYTEIEDWVRQMLTITAQDSPDARHVAITLHGLGHGLDEIEAMHAEVRGILDAVTGHKAPEKLLRVSIIEPNAERVQRLEVALAQLNAGTTPPAGIRGPADSPTPPAASAPQTPDPYDVTLHSEITVRRPLRLRIQRPGTATTLTDEMPDTPAIPNLQSTAQVEQKPRAFVAMPFSEEMEDVFYYGIQTPVRQLGYICERVDQEAFTGDILDQVKTRIENAEIVIADLTGANPNVYLEEGYAWGKGRPTVLVANKRDDLKFDVRGQRCLKYQSIKDLEKLLTGELKSLGTRRKP